MTCRLALQAFEQGAMSPDGWAAALSAIDTTLSRSALGGQSTVVVLEINGDHLVGASVGDSGAWAIDALGCVDLTCRQSRKPLLGAGVVPAPIGPTALPPRLLVATDGLLKYCPHDEIDRLAITGTIDEAIDALVSRVRLRGGGFQDDVAIVLCEDAG
jgi:serine/threonine protein phosphatase PrpC